MAFDDVYVTGRFSDASFNIYNINNGSLAQTLTKTTGNEDAFVIKYDSSGNFKWATQMGGISYENSGLGICCSKMNDITHPQVYPISSICFLQGTPIQPDQGIIPIDKIDTTIHTIHKKRILNITQTFTNDKYLVCFEKEALGKNIPSQKTFISKNHEIFYKGKMRKSKYFLTGFEKVTKSQYNSEILYNVLMENHEKILVNNLVCETLHPKNITAQLYMYLNTLDTREQHEFIKLYNEMVIKTNMVFLMDKYDKREMKKLCKNK